MAKFAKGDEVRYIGEGRTILRPGEVCVVASIGHIGQVRIEGLYRDGTAPRYGVYGHNFVLVRTAAQVAEAKAAQTSAALADLDHANARATDPGTSKDAAKPKRIGLRQLVLDAIKAYGMDGANGHEIETRMARSLNSITPRLAELRKAGLIKDSGVRREKQIVWVAV